MRENPLNPDKLKEEKVRELVAERDKYRDLYVSESIKNKDDESNNRFIVRPPI